MGISRSAAQLARKIDTAVVQIQAGNKTGVKLAAEEAKKVTVGLMAAATGGDLMLSGTTRTTGENRSGGKKIGVRYKLEQRATGPQAFIAATGPAQLIERDVKPHIVVSRYAKGAGYTRVNARGNTVRGRTTRQSRQASVAFGLGAGGGGRRAVLHWGNNWARYTTASSRGRHPFERGINASIPRTRAIMARENRQALVRSFT